MRVLRNVIGMLGMLIFGLVALLIPALLVEAREGQPLRAQSLSPELMRSQAYTNDLDVLANGLYMSASVAFFELGELGNGNRSNAARALDAAMRAAEVGKYAAQRDADSRLFHNARLAVRAARHALQNGNENEARAFLGLVVLEMAVAMEVGLGPSARPPLDMRAFDGATLINAQGVRIGEVVEVSAYLTRMEVTVVLGGWRDVAGFMDWSGGTRVTLPARELLWGKHRTIGETLVALPTTRTPPNIDTRTFQARAR